MAFESFPTGNLSNYMVAQATDMGGNEQKSEPSKQGDASKSDGFLSELFGDRKERTLAGCAIGAVRDVFSGKLTEEEKVKRAEGNDFVATIAADTAAMMSKKVAMGGLVRATMMADTKGDARDFALGFMKDGLEGVGLNYIGKMAQPGSRAFEYAGARFGTGLKQEIALHAGSGALFGALKAGSDPLAWRDQSGHFSFESGLNNLTDWKKMSTATLSGAVINVPAGMLGMRIAKSSTLSVANRTGSESLGTVTGGVLSGGSSGAVFGGLDAIVHGKSLSEIGKSTFDGMLIGAGTGGVMTGWHAFGPGKKAPLESQIQEKLQPKSHEPVQEHQIQERVNRPVQDGQEPLVVDGEAPSFSEASRVKLTDKLESLTPQQRQKMFDTHDAASFTSAPKEGVAALNRQLVLDKAGVVTITRVKNDPDLPKAFKDDADFKQWTEAHVEQARIYRIEGTEVKIVVPETYAKKLDRIRELRAWAEADAPSFDGKSAAEQKVLKTAILDGDMELVRAAFGEKADNIARIIKARNEVDTVLTNQRALPEDFVGAVKELPDPSLIKEIILLDEPSHRDVYKRAKADELGNTSYSAGADADRNGIITFYEAYNSRKKGDTTGGTINGYLAHEWSHLVKFKLKEHSALFNETAEIEKDWYVREYARRQYPDHPELQHHENFAVHLGDELMAADADRFFITAHNAPIRTTMLAKALLEAMIPRTKETVVHPADFLERIDQIPANIPHRDAHVARLKYIAEEIAPIARDKLIDNIHSGNLTERIRASLLLGRFGNPNDVARVQTVLDTSTDPQLRKALFNSVSNIADRNLNARLNFLIENAKPGKPYREESLASLSGFQHPEAKAYYDVLRLSGSPNNQVELMNLIDKTPHTGPKQMAFEAIVGFASKAQYGSEFLQSYIVKLLQTQPDIRLAVINEAVKHPSLPIEIEIMNLSQSRDRAVAQRAKQAAAELGLARKLENYSKWIKGGNDDHKWQAIQELAWLDDNRAIPLLLEVMAGNNPKWSREAVEALKHYSPTIIAVEARHMQRNGSTLTWGEVQRQLNATRH